MSFRVLIRLTMLRKITSYSENKTSKPAEIHSLNKSPFSGLNYESDCPKES
jgi:hypothetical protein